MFKKNYVLQASLIFIASLFLFTYGLFDHEFIQFESRFGLFAQEMLRQGLSFFPTTYGNPYPDYPALQTSLIYFFSLLHGKVTILTAVLPTAIASALLLSLTFLLAAPFSCAWGWYAIWCELMTYQFFASARSVTLDPFVALATLLSFYCVFTAKNLNRPHRAYGLWAGLILGFLFRGFIGLIIPAAVVGGFYLVDQDYQKLWKFIKQASIALLVAAFLLMLAALHAGGLPFVKDVFSMQFTDRLSASQTTPLFYFGHAWLDYALAFPLAVFVTAINLPQLLRADGQKIMQLLRHLVVWTCIVMLGLSVPGARKIRYLLPIVPAISLLAGYLFIAAEENKLAKYARQCVVFACYALPFLGLVIIPACLIAAKMKSLFINAHYFSAGTLLIIEALAVFIADRKLRATRYYYPVFLTIGLAAFVTVNIFIIEPVTVSLNRTKPFVEEVMTARTIDEPIIFYKMGPDAEDIKFMVAYGEPLAPQFMQTPAELSSVNKPALFITKQEVFDALPADVKSQLQVVVTGNIGHRRSVAFLKK